MSLINLTINGKAVAVEEGTNILEAAKKVNIKIQQSGHALMCHYGIITTNGKSLDFQGVSAFVAVYSIPFPKLKYGEKIDEKRRLLH